jgi:hypothetical protein
MWNNDQFGNSDWATKIPLLASWHALQLDVILLMRISNSQYVATL